MSEFDRSMLIRALIPEADSDYVPPTLEACLIAYTINSLSSFGRFLTGGKAMAGKIAVVTGAGNGIGLAAAFWLVGRRLKPVVSLHTCSNMYPNERINK